MNFEVKHPIDPRVAELMEGLALLVSRDQLSLKDFGDQCHDLGFGAGEVSGAKIVNSDIERMLKST